MLFQNDLKEELKKEKEKKEKEEKEKAEKEKAEKKEEAEEAEDAEKAAPGEKQGGAAVAKLAGQLWNELSEEQRESYKEQALKVKEEHEKAHPELRKQPPKPRRKRKARQEPEPSAFYPTPDQTPVPTPGPSTRTPSRSGSETTDSALCLQLEPTTSASSSSSMPTHHRHPYSAYDLPCPGAASHRQSTSRTHPAPAQAPLPASGQLAGPSHERYHAFQRPLDALSSLAPATIQPTAPSYSDLPFNGIFPTANHADRVDHTISQFMNGYHSYHAHAPPALPPMVPRTTGFTSQDHDYGYFLPPSFMQGHAATPNPNTTYSALFGIDLPQHEPSLYSQPTVHAGMPDMSARMQGSTGLVQTMRMQADYADTAAVADPDAPGRPYSSSQFPAFHANLGDGYGDSMASHWTPQTSLENYQDLSAVHYGYAGNQYAPPADILGSAAYHTDNVYPAFCSQPAYQPGSEQERAELPALGSVPSDTANQVGDQGVEASMVHFLQTLDTLFDSEHLQGGYNPGL
ncbi:hypothetical protein C8Q74DRAFT_1235919 [Fomes fomentarius]|nr:hypothetical protein C8Q74DRAFT_1235919 [Fomes fomentarius]